MDNEKRRMKGFAVGYLAGLAGFPLAISPSSGPPAYAYNGIPLPPLQWDKKIFPYALIQYYQSSNMFRCCVYKKINYYQTPSMFGLTETYFGQQETGGAMMFDYTLGEPGWVKHQSEPIGVRVDRGTTAANVVWSNFDLMWSDGTLFVGASEPEPITAPGMWEDMYFHNSFVCAKPFSDLYDDHYRHFIVKIGNMHVAFSVFNWTGGGMFGVYGSTLWLYPQFPSNYVSVKWLDQDSGKWIQGSIEDYLGEETYEYNGYTYYRICGSADIVWSEEDIFYLIPNGREAYYGSEPIPVSIPEPEAEKDPDNKAIMLGCRLGYIIRSQMGKGNEETDVPMGVLISSDGYILRDCNGVYLIAKEDA